MKKVSKDKGTTVGIKHFLEFMFGGQPEWSLFAVRAPIQDVSSAFSKYRKAKATFSDVVQEPAGTEGDELAPLVAIVQVRDSPWTVVFRSLLWLRSSHLEEVPKEAKELSARLKTRTITFFGEDTSSAMGYEIFEDGKSVAKEEWEGGDEEADAVFTKQGIYLPSCYPKAEGKKKWLAVDKKSADMIERADLVDLGL
jgi:hypothetical protein